MATNFDLKVMDFLASHLPDEKQLIFAGPDKGAHHPTFFMPPAQLPDKYPGIKKAAQIIRTTAALYTAPHRVVERAEMVWSIACDFDFDRGEWEGVPREEQEATLYESCQIIPPTFATRTRNGFHLYWVLETPEPVFNYTYIASLIKDTLKADPHSIVPTHCLSFFSRGRKPAQLVPAMEFPAIRKTLPIDQSFETIYTTNSLLDELKANTNPNVLNLFRMYQSSQKKTYSSSTAQEMKWRGEVDSILEYIDVTETLKRAGYFAYNRGRNKIITVCPYHYDRNPSAFINIDPTSPFYGQFNCSSCKTKKQLKTVLRDLGLDF